MSRQITQGTVFRVLIAGFLLEILLLAGAAFISLHSIGSIRSSAAELVGEELAATRLIDDIQHEQAALSAVFMKLSRDPEAVDREKVLSELDQADARMEDIGRSFAGTPDRALWNELRQATGAFSAEARRLLMLESPTTLLSRELFRRNQEALSVVARLAGAIDNRTRAIRDEIDHRSNELTQHTVLLVGACVLLALIIAGFTVRTVAGLFRKMQQQTGELSRVSWHMLESQETTARRFSHELHDELGQALTALKANLHALAADGVLDRRRLEDCVGLVNDAIANVREISQLLHPTLLDDFGLAAAVRWLAERFRERTGIEARYESDFEGRLPEETETHLFRICQEALTNVARHSGASEVRIRLLSDDGKVRLLIEDNGRGLPGGLAAETPGMGLIGMRARARSAGGELEIRSWPGKGLSLEVEVPARGEHEQEQNPNLVGR